MIKKENRKTLQWWRRRRKRRIMRAVWQPNTPRYACASSTTTYLRWARKHSNWQWDGMMETCSMSGLVINTRADSRSLRRSSWLVSPSYTPMPNFCAVCGPPVSSSKARSWSCANACSKIRHRSSLCQQPPLHTKHCYNKSKLLYCAWKWQNKCADIFSQRIHIRTTHCSRSCSS
jgi:hypothetical protein